MVVFTRTAGGKLLYDTCDSLSGWTVVRGSPNWAQGSGYWYRSGTSNNARVIKKACDTGGNKIYEFDAWFTSSDASNSNYTALEICSPNQDYNPYDQGYLCCFYGRNANYFKVWKVTGGSLTDLGSQTVTFSDNTWYTVKIIRSGSNITMYLNNASIKTWTDGTYTTGEVLRVCGTSETPEGRIDNIKAYTSETITVTGLKDGQKFKLYNSGGSLVGTSGAASGGQATLSVSSLSSRPPYQKIAVTDTDGSTVKWTMDSNHSAYNDIWGGDTFEYKTTVTLTVSPTGQGLQVRLDAGTWYTAPKTYDYTPYSGSHTIEAESSREVVAGQKRYVWANWSDSGAISHSISWPTGDATYTASYTLQWYFDVTSAHDSPTGEGWYNDGATASSSVTTPVTESGIIWECAGYTGTGSCPSSGSGSSVNFTITAYSTCTWNWQARMYADRNLNLNVVRAGFADRSFNVNVEKLSWLDRNVFLSVEQNGWADRSVQAEIEKVTWLDRNVLAEIEPAGAFEDRTLCLNVELLGWVDRAFSANIRRVGFLDRSLNVNVERSAFSDRNVFINVEKLGWIDRSLTANVEKLGFVDRAVAASVVYPAWLSRNVSLNVERLDWAYRNIYIDVEKLDWLDRNLRLDVEKLDWFDRSVYVNVRQVGFLDCSLTANVERLGWTDRPVSIFVVYPNWLDRSLRVDVEKIGWLDQNLSLDVFNYEKGWVDRAVYADVQRFGEPMLGSYHFPHVQKLSLTWSRSIARKDIAGRDKDYRADLGGLGVKGILTGFIRSDNWESARQALEAKIGEGAARFDDGTGIKFNAIVYDVEFSREVTDPITGRKGVLYMIYLAEV